MERETRILCLGHTAAEAKRIDRALRQGGLSFSLKRADTKEEFLEELQRNPPDVILAEHDLLSLGTSPLALAQAHGPEIPVILVADSLREQQITELLRRGATDYVMKHRLTRLALSVQRVLREVEDRNELKQLGQALRQCEECHRMLVEGVKDYAIYLLDPTGCVRTWNAGAETIEGYAGNEILGKHFATFFTPEDVQHGLPSRLLQAAAEEGRTVNQGWRVRKDGSRFWTEGILTALYDEQGALRGFSKIARDFTEQKAAAEEIQRLNEQLEQRVRERTAELEEANKELEAFSYSVSHDLRTPLRHIAGYAALLQREAANLDEPSRQHLQIIANSAVNLGDLIDALLAFSRVGRAEFRRQEVRLSVLVEEAQQELHREIESRGPVEWRIGPLPTIQGDPLMLRQVLINLLSNALKYTRGREPTRIEIGATESERETVVFVRDNGVGFDMRHADKLFGVFQRLHPSSQFEGIGIGLANVWRIIHRHGGRVWAEGVVNGGATFFFSIPKK